MQKLKVIFEDNHIIVVEKPVNIPSQGDKTGDIDMLTIIKEYLKEKYNKPGNVYLGLIHRLDRPVGGVMVFAKTSKAAARLSEQVREKIFKKTYLVVVNGKMEEERGKQAELTEIEEKAGQSEELWQKDYEKQTAQKSYAQFRDNFERRQKANWTLRDKAIEQMQSRMIEYKTEYNFGAAPTMAGFPEFEAIYERLRTSELLDYEEKVQSARQSAEDEFREQFLAKLQENMKQAQNEFKELNKALKDIVFSNEKYEFLYMPSRRHRRYYDMIMDDFNMVQGESIFSGVFHETHKEVIEELFDRLTIDNDNNAKTLDEFTDYRTYMDYDIRILHTDGSYSLYSI